MRARRRCRLSRLGSLRWIAERHCKTSTVCLCRRAPGPPPLFILKPRRLLFFGVHFAPPSRGKGASDWATPRAYQISATLRAKAGKRAELVSLECYFSHAPGEF